MDQEEIKREAEQSRMDFILSVFKWAELIKRGGSSVVKCPVCGGELHIMIARCNGHVHAKCDDCGNGIMQ